METRGFFLPAGRWAPSAQNDSVLMEGNNRISLAIELAAVTAALLIVSHALFIARGNAFIGPALSTIVAILFLYTPIMVLWYKRRSIDFLDRGWRPYARSFAVFAAISVIVFPLFVTGAHLWQLFIAGKSAFRAAPFPNFLNIALFQLLLIALPEEFYFRGYFQSAMNLIFERRWRVLGTNLGWGWIITAAVFAFAHTIVVYQWWHFSIFFPALIFGYLRERTGSITAPILFHAASNILMDWVSRSYI